MKETRKSYSKEFKQKTVELSRVRGNVQEITQEFNVKAELIYRLSKEFENNPSLAFSGKGVKHLTEEQKELSRLRRELADVKMERDILKKAVSIFSVSDRKSSNL